MKSGWLWMLDMTGEREREREMSQKMFIEFKCCWRGLHNTYVVFDNIKGRWL